LFSSVKITLPEVDSTIAKIASSPFAPATEIQVGSEIFPLVASL
jgi:hypothetical protein